MKKLFLLFMLVFVLAGCEKCPTMTEADFVDYAVIDSFLVKYQEHFIIDDTHLAISIGSLKVNQGFLDSIIVVMADSTEHVVYEFTSQISYRAGGIWTYGRCLGSIEAGIYLTTITFKDIYGKLATYPSGHITKRCIPIAIDKTHHLESSGWL